MDPNAALDLLGGLSPSTFMRRHWQKTPLLVRRAWPGVRPPLARAALFALAARDGVESRLVERGAAGAADWRVRHGPLPRRSLPPLARPGWTLLVQGLDLHVPAARALLDRFRFLPDARLDDVMVSWASPGGGVGAHVDRYDVFLLQVQGVRRWRVGRLRTRADREPVAGAPLALLRRFAPEHDWLLEPGDLLYLPPLWGHDGVAVGDGSDGGCITCSIGFRSPTAGELARELLLRLADRPQGRGGAAAAYRDPAQRATAQPAALPPALVAYARRALDDALADPRDVARAVGELLSEPKPQVWFDPPERDAARAGALRLDDRTRMLYDERHLYINGESHAAAAGGRDGRLLRALADARRMSAADRARLGPGASARVDDWIAAGWAHAAPD